MSCTKRLASITLQNQDSNIEDVQLWLDVNDTEMIHCIPEIYTNVSVYLNYKLIPLYLLLMKPLTVYSTLENTTEFFKSNLLPLSLGCNENVSLLYKAEDESYLAFYFDINLQRVKAIVLNFELLMKIKTISENNLTYEDLDASTFVDLSDTAVSKSSDISVFDKVLSQKKMNTNPFIVNRKPINTPLSASTLTTNDQINQAVSKVILSGLRIRGLSTNFSSSVNEKLTIKEIYQMTYKATLFSLRKFSYSFNNTKNHSLKLNDIQETVEKLLQIFIDIEDNSTSANIT